MAVRAHHHQIELALARECGDLLSGVADLVLELGVEPLLGEERADRLERRLGFARRSSSCTILLASAPAARAGIGPTTVSTVKRCCLHPERFVVRGQVGQHALGVFAAVDSDQNLHGRSSRHQRPVTQASIAAARQPAFDARHAPACDAPARRARPRARTGDQSPRPRSCPAGPAHCTPRASRAAAHARRCSRGSSARGRAATGRPARSGLVVVAEARRARLLPEARVGAGGARREMGDHHRGIAAVRPRSALAPASARQSSASARIAAASNGRPSRVACIRRMK